MQDANPKWNLGLIGVSEGVRCAPAHLLLPSLSMPQVFLFPPLIHLLAVLRPQLLDFAVRNIHHLPALARLSQEQVEEGLAQLALCCAAVSNEAPQRPQF